MSDDLIPFDDLTSPAASRSLAYGRLAGDLEVVPFGIPGLDRNQWFWGGRQGVSVGEYGLIAGASSIGKTQLGLYLLKQASRVGMVSAMVSLEMKREDIQLRLAQSWVPELGYKRWEPGRWGEEEQRLLIQRAKTLRSRFKAPILINGKQRGDLSWVLDALNTVKEAGARFVIVDHLQLIKVDGYVSEVAARSEIVSEAIRDWTFTNDVTTIALSQLKRSASDQFDRSPTIHDLLGGTAIESNASQIWLLDHSRYKKDPANPGCARTWIGHGKNRAGPSRYWVPVYVNHAALTFREATEEERRRWPDRDNKKEKR